MTAWSDVGSVAKEDGRTYVVAGHFDGEDPTARRPSEDLWWFRPETSVLAAFDDAGVELWRTELDGAPSDVVVVDGDLWVSCRGWRRDGVTDRRLRRAGTRPSDHRAVDSMVGAFGSVWFESYHPGPRRDWSGSIPICRPTSIEIPVVATECDYCPHDPTAGPDAMWLPLGQGGVAMIDPDTNQATVIPVDDIGHEVLQVAVDGDVAYVASLNRVTSIVDGKFVATLNPGEIWYLGPVDGAFGVLNSAGWFRVLGANDPMVVELGRSPSKDRRGRCPNIDGEAWIETGRNYNLRRVEFLPVAGADG